MNLRVDNQVIRLFTTDGERVKNTVLELGLENQIGFDWPALLEYLELGDLFTRFPVFDETSVLFKATISALSELDSPDDLFYIYDSLFTEMLKCVKNLEEVDPLFLLEKSHNYLHRSKESCKFQFHYVV